MTFVESECPSQASLQTCLRANRHHPNSKRQYVYRLSEWGARKYNPPPPEAEQGESNAYPGVGTQNHDYDAACKSPQEPWVQGLHPSPVEDWQPKWLTKMKLRADSQLVLPRNTAALSGYKRLYDAMIPEDESTPLYGANLDACVFSALADHIDPEDQIRIDTIIAGLRRETPSQLGSGELRRRLQLHVLEADSEADAFRTMDMVEEFFMEQHCKTDLNMFLLLMLFKPSYGIGDFVIDHGKRTLEKYVESLQRNQEAQSTLDQGIKWCKTICNSARDKDLRLDVKPSDSNEQDRLNMAEVSCLLFAQLLPDNEDEPEWAKNVEASLGISKTTFAVTVVCMAQKNSGRWFGLPVTPYQQVSHGLDMLSAEGTADIWQMFLEAFAQVHSRAYMGHPHTFTQPSMDQSPCGDDFIKNLTDAVGDFIEYYQPSELSDSPSSLGQVGSVFGDPPTPLQSADDNYYTQHMDASLGDDGDFGRFYYPNTFPVGKDLGSYPLFVAAADTSMDMVHSQASYMASQ